MTLPKIMFLTQNVKMPPPNNLSTALCSYVIYEWNLLQFLHPLSNIRGIDASIVERPLQIDQMNRLIHSIARRLNHWILKRDKRKICYKKISQKITQCPERILNEIENKRKNSPKTASCGCMTKFALNMQKILTWSETTK